MLIDWFTVIAQIVNFLILIALLKYFLYGRIIRAMDEREKKIASKMQEAEQEKEAAAREARSFREKKQEIEKKGERMLSQAKEEAEARRSELIQEARDEVANLKTGWQEAIQREKESFIRDFSQMASRQIYAIARRAFEDLADAELEEHAIEVFLTQVRKMKNNERKKFAESIKKAGNVVTLRSAFVISTNMQKEITSALHEHIADGIKVQYETASELVLGIELMTRGQKIAWSLENYLKTLEEKAREALEKKSH